MIRHLQTSILRLRSLDATERISHHCNYSEKRCAVFLLESDTPCSYFYGCALGHHRACSRRRAFASAPQTSAGSCADPGLCDGQEARHTRMRPDKIITSPDVFVGAEFQVRPKTRLNKNTSTSAVNLLSSLQILHADPMLFQCWSTVADGGPTLKHIGSTFRACWENSTWATNLFILAAS